MKNQDSILLFGASGQIGKSLIRKFTKNNYKVIAVTRNIHRKGYQIKTQSNYGYLELEELTLFSEENISLLIRRASICINLIGILYEKRKNHFNLSKNGNLKEAANNLYKIIDLLLIDLKNNNS